MGQKLEQKWYIRFDIVVPTNSKPASKYEHRLVQFAKRPTNAQGSSGCFY
jgi:hypothetical protein